MIAKAAISCVLLCIASIAVGSIGGTSKPDEQNVAAIVQAVEDEIYDYGYEKDYVNIGSTGAIDSPTEVTIFISPDLYNDGHGVVIYKYMPFGEVERRFAFRPDGLAVLWGKPVNHFPATQPDTNTLYLRDDDVCAFKQKAIRSSFTVDPNVSLTRRREAEKRQRIRIGYSDFLERHPKKRLSSK
jgi:hypothetical protein